MKQDIVFVDQKTTTEMVMIPDGYEFKPKGRLQWLQRMAWRFLHKREALQHAYEPKITVTRFTLNTGDFMRRLYEQRRSLCENYNLDGAMLLIGADDFSALMALPDIRQSLNFHVELRGQHPEIQGLSVRVIPWMSGALVLPKGYVQP